MNRPVPDSTSILDGTVDTISHRRNYSTYEGGDHSGVGSCTQFDENTYVLSTWCCPLDCELTCGCGNDEELVFPPPDFSSAA